MLQANFCEGTGALCKMAGGGRRGRINAAAARPCHISYWFLSFLPSTDKTFICIAMLFLKNSIPLDVLCAFDWNKTLYHLITCVYCISSLSEPVSVPLLWFGYHMVLVFILEYIYMHDCLAKVNCFLVFVHLNPVL